MLNADPQITETIKNEMHSIRGWSADERKRMGCDTLAGIREYVQISIDEVRERIGKRAVTIAPATSFAAIREHLNMARIGLMQYAATDAQIDLIARLAVEQGLAASQICGTSGLTKGEASAIISTMRR